MFSSFPNRSLLFVARIPNRSLLFVARMENFLLGGASAAERPLGQAQGSEGAAGGSTLPLGFFFLEENLKNSLALGTRPCQVGILGGGCPA